MLIFSPEKEEPKSWDAITGTKPPAHAFAANTLDAAAIFADGRVIMTMTRKTSTRPATNSPHSEVQMTLLPTTPDPAIAAQISMLELEISRLRGKLEADRTTINEGINGVMEAIRRREWLRLGRGSYEWDDDRWKDEFKVAIEEIEASLEPLRRVAIDWSGCPTDPAEIAAARQQR